VEDHAINQMLARTLLERWGHKVTVADNGQIAVDLLAQRSFDVVLMDMMMPVMDGLEATIRIRQSETGTRVPIIAMTANAMESDRQRCLDVGMDDYLSKPIKALELQQKLQLLARPAPQVPQGVSVVSEAASVRVPASNFDYAASLVTVDQEIVSIIAQAFIDQWPDDLSKLRRGLATSDLPLVLHTAHALKGTLSTFGAVPASQLAHRMESGAAARNAAAIEGLVDPLADEVGKLIAALGAVLAE
jgi:CheY-like chemotaxis protein/HPt (histidine-containing phosphotransfer) domain-containing protein